MNKEHFHERYQALLKVKNTKTAKIGRGQDFEELFNDVFAEENILLKRSFHTSDNKSEQIDGAIEVLNRVILFEVKWVEKNLAASELYAFLGKIDNKLSGTLGLFLSKNKLSENFLNAITKGRKRAVFVIHGEDVDLIFKNGIIIKDYIAHCIRLYSIDNLTHYSVKEWLEATKNMLKAEQSSRKLDAKIDKEAIKKILSKILSADSIPKHEIQLEIEDLSENEKIRVCNYLLQEYPIYHQAYLRTLTANRGKLENIENSLKILLSSTKIQKDTFLEYYDLYIKNPTSSYLREFLWSNYQSCHRLLNKEVKHNFEKALLKNFKSAYGSWEEENSLTMVIEDIWPTLSLESKDNLLEYYIDIFFSSRKDHYDQKRFSNKVVNDKKNNTNLKNWIENKIIEEARISRLTVGDIDSEVKYIDRYYAKAQSILSLDKSDWISFITDTLKSNITKS